MGQTPPRGGRANAQRYAVREPTHNPPRDATITLSPAAVFDE
jgi:hypothetical protein